MKSNVGGWMRRGGGGDVGEGWGKGGGGNKDKFISVLRVTAPGTTGRAILSLDSDGHTTKYIHSKYA